MVQVAQADQAEEVPRCNLRVSSYTQCPYSKLTTGVSATK